MSKILSKEIKKIEILISTLSGKVDDNLRKSIKSLTNNDIILANKVIKEDENIDRMEMDIEEECLKVLALHQPVAIDLRYIIAILKINNDLERIGDLSSNIADITKLYSNKNTFDLPNEIVEMKDIVLEMLKNSLDSFIYRDPNLAKKVQISDDLVDDLHSKMYELVKISIKNNMEVNFDFWLPMLSVSRYLERIADHCTNISEDVEYLITGNITRHK